MAVLEQLYQDLAEGLVFEFHWRNKRFPQVQDPKEDSAEKLLQGDIAIVEVWLRNNNLVPAYRILGVIRPGEEAEPFAEVKFEIPSGFPYLPGEFSLRPGTARLVRTVEVRARADRPNAQDRLLQCQVIRAEINLSKVQFSDQLPQVWEYEVHPRPV